MSEIPNRIWLQWNGDKIQIDAYTDDYPTWCNEKINDDDIEYHRAPEWVAIEDGLPEEDKLQDWDMLIVAFKYEGEMYFSDGSIENGELKSIDSDMIPLYWMIVSLPPALK